MAKKRNETNIRAFYKKKHFNIGVIIFGIIFIYLIATVLMYLTNDHVSVYEVREGSILRDTAYTGFVLRDEQVVTAEIAGYVNYFATEGDKVGAKTQVYTISNQALEFKTGETSDAEELTAEEQTSILSRAQSFSENYTDEQFRDVYTLKTEIQTVLESKSSQSRHAQLEDMKGQYGDALQVFPAAGDGVIQYYTDGYEGVTLQNVTKDMIQKTTYEKKSFTNNSEVQAGNPVYKLITDDKWMVVISLDDKTASELADTKTMKVRFAKDNETAKASFSIQNTSAGKLGCLTFYSAMVRYAQERYLDVELILEDESGLKIPKSSVVNKDFYIVSEDYLTQGGDSKENGVLIDQGKDSATFQKATVYYKDEENGLIYLDPRAFEEGTTLIKPNSTDTCRLSKTKSLQGVYNINKGYAVFKQIRILCESDEYYIVEEGNNYGLTNYDHIALDGDTVKEDDIVF